MINRLRAYPSVCAAASKILREHERLRDLTVQIQQIPSPTDDEAQIAGWVASQFRSLQIREVFIDDMHNVYARIPGERAQPALLVSAHTDTVFPADTDLSVRIDEQEKKIYGPSIGDNSAGVAALIYLAEVLSQLQPPVDMWLVANTGEEGLGDLRGMRAVVDRLEENLGAAIVLEGMGLGRIVHRGLGSRRYRVGVEAPGGHSWSDFGRPSAIHLLAQIAAEISNWQVPSRPRSTFNIGKISGGTSVNTIARSASMELDLRSESSDALRTLIRNTEALIAGYQANEALGKQNVRTVLNVIGDRPSGHISANHPLVLAAREALRLSGIDAVTLRISSTDANVPLSRGIPAICVGATVGGGAHRMEEWISSRTMPQGVHHLLLLIWWATLWLADEDPA